MEGKEMADNKQRLVMRKTEQEKTEIIKSGKRKSSRRISKKIAEKSRQRQKETIIERGRVKSFSEVRAEKLEKRKSSLRSYVLPVVAALCVAFSYSYQKEIKDIINKIIQITIRSEVSERAE
jgi:hypothetical protein